MMHDLWSDVSMCMCMRRRDETDSKPMCEWMTRLAQRIESMRGLREPEAKGAMVKGMRATDMILQEEKKWLVGGDIDKMW